MTDKFDIKDYLNYSISGLLWIVIIIKILDISSILKIDELLKLNQLNNSGIFIVLILLFGTYLIGNLFRFTEKALIFVTRMLYGNLYFSALCTDRNKYIKSEPKERILKLGLLYYCFGKRPLGIGLNLSNRIEINLRRLNIFNELKKSQHIMCENYLIMNYSELKYERLKNLKNLYESISFPFFVCAYWFSQIVICSCNIGWHIKTIIIVTILFAVYKFIDRYKYLKSNYIKDIYRYFVFEFKKN